ncbi:MAG: alpha-mannosidase [Eubacteriales bacterium]|jgi:alpha-mannosidase|nr:alpha-mannosidase [Clostridiales bacterium]
MNISQKFDIIHSVSNSSYWAKRIDSQLRCLAGLSKIRGGEFDSRIEAAADELVAAISENQTLPAPVAQKVEAQLSDLSDAVKAYTIYCVSHAHIDMNWMWGYQETAAVTIDTFRTILTLMDEYPEFKYSQSQASVYRIVEKHAPEMIEEIKRRVHEGRWEVSASTWVETDKNMPNGESLSRHILYTKRYLSRLLDISPDSIKIDFEPDTFGHNANVPEILQNGGVDYYYHCRAHDQYFLYNWESPSGKRVLVFRDPRWYNGTVEYDSFVTDPLFCHEHGVDVNLFVYGVGDHGGGPTRRDVERIIDMSSWPLYPTIKFGTYAEYFAELEKFRDKLPTVNHELNFVFTGCYTSQSRIKMSNRIAEDRLYDSEALSACAYLYADSSPKVELFASAWENTLFNHFHDILPGSCVIETREYALGRFQEALATINICANSAMREIGLAIDTSSIDFDENNHTISEGAGVGFNVDHSSGHLFPQTERGRGNVRVLHLFNTTMYDRREPVEVTVWDYPGDFGRVYVTDAGGNKVPFQITAHGHHYWGHHFTKLLIMAEVPAFGYTTYILRQMDSVPVGNYSLPRDPRSDNHIGDSDLVLENEHIRAVFGSTDIALKSLVDKKTGEELVDPAKPACIFRRIDENPRFGMTSWRVGPYMNALPLNTAKNVRLTEHALGALKKWISYQIKFDSSVLDVTISLPENSRTLEFDVRVDWHEIGRPETGIPQLNFYVPVKYAAEKYRYDIPFGMVDRSEMPHDVPANSFMQIYRSEGPVVSIVTDSKYGFRGNDNAGAVTLIRSSYDPDPYPELGKHHMKLGVMVTSPDCAKKHAHLFCHPVAFASATKHGGTLPLEGRAFELDGNVMVSAVKTAEEGGLILRVSDWHGEKQHVSIKFAKTPVSAALVDITERHKLGDVNIAGNTVSFDVDAYSIATLHVKF